MKIPLTIQETHTGLMKKDYSVVDLVDAYLARITAFDKDINAFITVTEDEAYKQAKEADRLIQHKGEAAFEEFPLLGVVTSYKDIFMTKGIRTTAASNVLRNYKAQYTATAVSRIQNAGAVMLGKLNLDAWAHGSSGENSDFGPTKNPWNTDYVPGGSSSGSGAAMAANFSLVTTGTDTCGSIRLPANYCGVYGLKPTYGSVSRYGIIAMASSLDSVGHFGRTVDDVKRVFEVTRGTDGKDSTIADYASQTRASGLRIGIPREFFGEGLSDDVKSEVERVINQYRTMGIDIVDVSLPSTKYGISVYYILQPAEVSSNLGRYDGVRFGNNRDSFGDEAKRRIMLGSYVLSSGYYDAYYLKAQKVRSKIIAEIDVVFETVDALLAPVAPTPAFKLGTKVDDPLQMYLTDIYAATANLSGIASLSIPSGFTNEGLPLGFQLMGPRFSEYTLFDLARRFEEATGYEPKVANL